MLDHRLGGAGTECRPCAAGRLQVIHALESETPLVIIIANLLGEVGLGDSWGLGVVSAVDAPDGQDVSDEV